MPKVTLSTVAVYTITIGIAAFVWPISYRFGQKVAIAVMDKVDPI